MMMGARKPSPAPTVDEPLGVYSGVYWTPSSLFWDLLEPLGVYCGVYCASLESILKSIEAPWKSPGGGSQGTQPGADC